VGLAGIVVLVVGVVKVVEGYRKKFLDDSKTDEMSQFVFKGFTVLGTIGHVARAVVFGLVAVFLIKAAYDYKANEAIGLDGALQKLAGEAYGAWLLGAVALGLGMYGLFCLVEAKYRDV